MNLHITFILKNFVFTVWTLQIAWHCIVPHLDFYTHIHDQTYVFSSSLVLEHKRGPFCRLPWLWSDWISGPSSCPGFRSLATTSPCCVLTLLPWYISTCRWIITTNCQIWQIYNSSNTMYMCPCTCTHVYVHAQAESWGHTNTMSLGYLGFRCHDLYGLCQSVKPNHWPQSQQDRLADSLPTCSQLIFRREGVKFLIPCVRLQVHGLRNIRPWNFPTWVANLSSSHVGKFQSHLSTNCTAVTLY